MRCRRNLQGGSLVFVLVAPVKEDFARVRLGSIGKLQVAQPIDAAGAGGKNPGRAVTPQVGQKLLDKLAWWEEYTRGHKTQFNGVVGPGNQEGGLTNIFEKSLGSAMKGGTTPLQEVYDYAVRIDKAGFVFMDSPGYDPVAATGLIASGANMILFTTGRGSMFGSKPAPTIKLATNTPMFRELSEDMDVNCGLVLDGECTVEEMGKEIFAHILKVASGARTKSEELGLGDHEFVPWHLGIVS